MDKKITRRVVLGTAITGLVAVPFVVRLLRTGKDLPESEFSRQWKKHQGSINSYKFVKDDAVISEAGLFLNVPPDQMNLNMESIVTISNDGTFSDIHDTSCLPDVFTYVTGEIQIDSMKNDGQYKGYPVIRGNLSDTTIFSSGQENMVEKAPPSFSFLSDGLKRFRVLEGNVEEKEMPYNASGITAMALPIEFPLKTKFRKETTWTNGIWTNNYNIPLRFSVVHAGRLDGKEVMLVEGKTALDPDSFQKHLQAQLLNVEREDLRTLWESKLKSSQQDSRGISILTKQYVSVEIGVVMRSEITTVLSVPEEFGFGATTLTTRFDWS